MDVSDWQDSSQPIAWASRVEPRFSSPVLLGVVGTLLLHALIAQSVYVTGRGRIPLPQVRETRSAAETSSASAEGLMVVELTSNSPRSTQIKLNDSFLKSLSQSALKVPVDVDLPLPINIPLALNEDEGTQGAASAADNAETHRLAGIYSGQIQARIERLWRRPRTPVKEGGAHSGATDESFQCEAQIVQDAQGYVLEVLLPRCNGTVMWQQSLLLAIRQASPLPVPPSARVFSPSIALRFIGLPYSKGSREDEYDMDRMVASKR